jgi:large subunit ribosomal protein L32
MAVPKKKVSKSRSSKRFAANFKISAPTLTECLQCHEPKRAHCVCKKCGYYDGQQRVAVETPKAKE